MKDERQYSVVKFRYSIALGELINIGILFYNPESAELTFQHPKSLSRLSNLYDAHTKSRIKAYQKAFKDQVIRVNKRCEATGIFESTPSIFGDRQLDQVIRKNFITPDDTSIVFEPASKIPFFPSVYDDVYKQNFPFYEDRSSTKRRDEAYITRRFESRLTEAIEPSVFNSKVSRDVVIEAPLLKEKFSFGWQNGVFNAVTPISFDLNDEQHIKDKSLRWAASIQYLGQTEQYNDVNFDLLITEPDRGKNLYQTVNKALSRFQSLDGCTVYVNDEGIEEYIVHAAEYLTSK